MKIYLLKVPKDAHPEKTANRMPPHNDHYGVEQDFYKWLKGTGDYKGSGSPVCLCDNPSDADWHYLPIYWFMWYLNHGNGARDLDQMEAMVRGAVIDTTKTFTVCQYSRGLLNGLHLNILPFYASRRGDEGFDIPLLCKPHQIPTELPRKRHLASFVGRANTHPIRNELKNAIGSRGDILFEHSKGGRMDDFIKKCLASYCVLAPRGYGGDSFRFYEAMQIGRVPMLIGDIDTRPFKRYIDWDSCSLYADVPYKAVELLDKIGRDELLAMGKRAKQLYYEDLQYGKWCKFVIKELEDYAVQRL